MSSENILMTKRYSCIFLARQIASVVIFVGHKNERIGPRTCILHGVFLVRQIVIFRNAVIVTALNTVFMYYINQIGIRINDDHL